MRQQFRTIMLTAPSQLDDIFRRCAERFATAPHLYYIEDWRGTVLVLKFYGDKSFGRKESGFQGCYAVAGYITGAEVWQRDIAEDWQRALDAHPKISYFRMRECFAGIEGKPQEDEGSPFFGMSTNDAKQKLETVVSVLEKHARKIISVESIITWDCFTHALSEADKDLLQSPYYFCVNGMVDGCRQALRDMKREAPVAFVLDERPDVSESILRAWFMTKDSSPEDAAIMGAISFADDKKCLPLQCADLLAWHARRQFIQPAEDHGRSRPEYSRLRGGTSYSHIWNEEKLRVDRAEKRRALELALAQRRKRVD